MGSNPRIVNLSQLHKLDEDLISRKAHEIGELWKLGLPLPRGFVITPEFFYEFLRLTGIDKEIKKINALNHPAIASSIENLFEPTRKMILHAHIPPILSGEVHEFYRHISGGFREKPLNIHSFSFKNKLIKFLNVKGDANLILNIKNIWAGSIMDPATIIVQENVPHEIKGKFATNNPSFDENLTKLQISELTKYCNIIRKHFYFPHEVEYIISKGRAFVTNFNPYTGDVKEIASLAPTPLIASSVKQKIETRTGLIKGICVNPGIATGPIKILYGKYKDAEVRKGEIVILPDLNSSLLKNLKNAKAVIADSALPTPLSKTVYRKLFKIPTVEGVKNATLLFNNGNVVTVNGSTGEIFAGGLI